MRMVARPKVLGLGANQGQSNVGLAYLPNPRCLDMVPAKSIIRRLGGQPNSE